MNTPQTKALLEVEQAIAKSQNLQTQARPWITLSFGMSLDGKIATYTGDSKYISGEETRQFVHQLRHRHQGILVGIQTVITDHPSLTTRLRDLEGKDAHRFILDSQLRMPEDEPILRLASKAKTYVVTKRSSSKTKQQALIQKGAMILTDPTDHPHIDLTWLMQHLLTLGVTSLMVEGGGTIHESFLKAGLFDLIVAQISPLLIGGKDAKTPVEGEGFPTLASAVHVAFHNHFVSGRDIIVIAKAKS